MAGIEPTAVTGASVAGAPGADHEIDRVELRKRDDWKSGVTGRRGVELPVRKVGRMAWSIASFSISSLTLPRCERD